MTASESTTDGPYDVAIVGAGPAGCAAGVFTARAGLETIVFDHGQSTLQKSAFVENYLGFPEGITPRELLAISRDHARTAGCTLVSASVEPIVPDGEGFLLPTEDGEYRTEYVLAASWSCSDFLSELDVKTRTEEVGGIDVVLVDADGQTNVDRVYAAGRITSAHHQTIVSAGDGARVGLNIVNRAVPDFYNDWIAPVGYYEQYDREVPVGVEEIDHTERRRRAARARERMRQFFSRSRE